MSVYLYRLGRLCFRHRRVVVGVWLVAIVGVVVAALLTDGKTSNDYTIPGTESNTTQEVLQQQYPQAAGAVSTVVFAVPAGQSVRDAPAQPLIQQAQQELSKASRVLTVTNPLSDQTVSSNGRVAYAQVIYDAPTADLPPSVFNDLNGAVATARTSGVQVEFTGQVYPGYGEAQSDLPSELVGLLVALIVLLVTFGALAAAGLPLVSAMAGVAVSLASITAISSVVSLISAAPTMAIMLGLACGIDYSLFVIARHQSNLLHDVDPETSAALGLGTAGGAVVFAAISVIIATCGLAVAGIPFLTRMGLCAAAAVLVAALAALTLLPAMLGFAGNGPKRFLGRSVGERKRRLARDPDSGVGARWSRLVVRRRWIVLAAGVVLLLVLAVPALSMRLGLPTGGSSPTNTTQRKGADLLADNFGIGLTGPLTTVVEASSASAQPAATTTVVDTVRGIDGVVAISTPSVNPAGNLAVLQVIPATGPEATQTADLVRAIRDATSDLNLGAGTRVLVGGTTATNIDTSKKLGDALPLFVFVVVGLALILLTLAFRSLVVPVVAVVGFGLTIAASFGVEVAVFQWGWLSDVFGVTPSPTVCFLPIIILAVLFGLSNDYEVFVVSRIREDYVTTGEAVPAVRRGLAKSSKVVAPAAIVMFSVFASFLIHNDPIVQPIALTLAFGVIADAFVVRLSLVPATLAMLGKHSWALGRFFGRIVPDLDVEGANLAKKLSADEQPAHADEQPVRT